MEYRKVGKWGIRISELSLGSWLTFGKQLDIDGAKKIVREAFKSGINFFDCAEAYANGMAESMLGQVLKEFKREDYVVSTKIFWAGKGPNDSGLSRKHLLEGIWNSLKRMQLDYVDIVYCHRPDPETPIEETVLAMDYIIRNGLALYWGTSEWSAEQIMSAHNACDKLNCIPPVVEQPQYNMLERNKVESEFSPLYEEKYGMGLTTFSPLASGLLTGKYNNGIPKGSRFDVFPELKKHFEKSGLFEEKIIGKIKKIGKIANDMGVEQTHLAIAWALKNEHVSSVILGVSKIEQLEDNLQAIQVKEKLDNDILKKINEILEG
ncbi:MAG: aldo/keto reductase [Kosmotoga sp.]|nr:MAG: aldo/keto reductase [Kosmotoga sp.]